MLTLSGLPMAWTPGQPYTLTVMVAKPGQSRFGFQLSAVADATNQQAGTFERISGNVFVISNGGIQYIEHSNATNVNTFTVKWTAPASASFGTIRFNLAGNAANGDSSPNGDFIYARVDKVLPAAAPPTETTVKAYTLVDRGGMSVITDGSGGLRVGYARIQPDSGQTTPAGVAIFGGRTGNTLVSETGVPATPALTTGRIYAEIAGAVNTGFAIVNPSSSTATINFVYTNTSGTDVFSGSANLAANSQITRFLSEDPFRIVPPVSTFQGTFSFTSSVPIGVIALRSYINERGDFLMSTLPVIDTSAQPLSGVQIIPHFADGQGWITQVLLVNPTDTPMTGLVQFNDDNGTGANVTIGGQSASSFSYNIPRRSSQKLATSGGAVLVGGSIRLSPTADGPAPTPLVVFSYKPTGIVVSEAGVPTTGGTAFRMYVESSGTDQQPGNIQSGIAVANGVATSNTVTFELTNLDGSTGGLPGSVTMNIGGRGHIGKFLGQIFPVLPNPFKGVLRISSGFGAISAVGLRARYNEQGNFLITTTPTTNENAAAPTGEYLFPDLANGGGYTTQFILFSGFAGQAASGNIRFFNPDGTPLGLILN